MAGDRLYPEDANSAFNEISTISTKELLTGIQELSKTQGSLKELTGKLPAELRQISLNMTTPNKNQTQNRPNHTN